MSILTSRENYTRLLCRPTVTKLLKTARFESSWRSWVHCGAMTTLEWLQERKLFRSREIRKNYGEKKWRAQQELNLQPLVP